MWAQATPLLTAHVQPYWISGTLRVVFSQCQGLRTKSSETVPFSQDEHPSFILDYPVSAAKNDVMYFD